ncbi:MAG: TIGR04282 family arsenosugar biosynthesis glycosyltransferase [Planctomycetaceae bacterium]
MADARPSRLLVIFCRYPEPGQVKTRLAVRVGDEPAVDFYAACLRDTFEQMQSCADVVQLAYTPDSAAARDWFRSWAGDAVSLWPQPGGDLGVRLEACFRSPAAQAATEVVVIGSDSPSLPVEYVTAAFKKLQDVDVVVGPARDGGYYLLGLSTQGRIATLIDEVGSWPSLLFREIAWSGPQVYDETLSRIGAAGRSLAVLPPWYDVDTFDDLHQLRAHLQRLQLSGVSSPCPRTAAVLATWPEEE